MGRHPHGGGRFIFLPKRAHQRFGFRSQDSERGFGRRVLACRSRRYRGLAWGSSRVGDPRYLLAAIASCMSFCRRFSWRDISKLAIRMPVATTPMMMVASALISGL